MREYGYPAPEERELKPTIDIETCKWVIWGAKRPYNTFGHIHEAFLRALKFLGKDAVWLDNGDDTSGIDFSNALVITMNCVLGGMPHHKGALYLIHNGNDPACQQYIQDLNVIVYGVHVSASRYGDLVDLGPDIYFDVPHRIMMFRWGTDLLPHEIQANKPAKAFNSDSRIVNYVGTVDSSNRNQIENFARACRENGIRFEFGGGHSGKPVVSDADHIRQIKESYLAPAIQRMDQVDLGYVPCRLFKNISYGQFGITHNAYANALFGDKLVFNTDTYRLFYDARERLQSMPVSELHSLMDEVAAKHTYLNKITAITQAVKILSE